MTYDIQENKQYSPLLKLMHLMFAGDNKLKQLGHLVLPIKTPPERYDEVMRKLAEKERKAEERKFKKAVGITN